MRLTLIGLFIFLGTSKAELPHRIEVLKDRKDQAIFGTLKIVFDDYVKSLIEIQPSLVASERFADAQNVQSELSLNLNYISFIGKSYSFIFSPQNPLPPEAEVYRKTRNAKTIIAFNRYLSNYIFALKTQQANYARFKDYVSAAKATDEIRLATLELKRFENLKHEPRQVFPIRKNNTFVEPNNGKSEPFHKSGKITNLLESSSLRFGNGNKKWHIVDGVLTPKGKGTVWSTQNFEDFELSLDFKMSKSSNGGVFLRGDVNNPIQGSLEIQIASQNMFLNEPKRMVGALYSAKEPKLNAVLPNGSWNSLNIMCLGSLLKVFLNDKLVIDLNLDNWDEPGKNPDGTKNLYKKPLKELPKKGKIGFQCLKNKVWYRNVVVTPL